MHTTCLAHLRRQELLTMEWFLVATMEGLTMKAAMTTKIWVAVLVVEVVGVVAIRASAAGQLEIGVSRRTEEMAEANKKVAKLVEEEKWHAAVVAIPLAMLAKCLENSTSTYLALSSWQNSISTQQ